MKRWLSFIALLIAWSLPLRAHADPPLLAMQRPNLLGSYVFAPVPVGQLTWSATDAAPGLTQATQTTDVAPPNMTFTAGAPWASASTHLVPGSLLLNNPAPVGAGTYGYTQIQQAGTTDIWLGALPGNPTLGALFFVTPSGTSNYALYGGAAVTVVDTPSGGAVDLDVANTIVEAVSGNAISLNQPVTTSGTLAVTGALTHPSPQTLACATGGTVTVATTPTSGFIVTSGTLASNCTIDFGTNATSGDFVLDMSGVTLGSSFGVVFKNGSASSATFLSGSVITTGDTMAHVWTHGANTLSVTY